MLLMGRNIRWWEAFFFPFYQEVIASVMNLLIWLRQEQVRIFTMFYLPLDAFTAHAMFFLL